MLDLKLAVEDSSIPWKFGQDLSCAVQSCQASYRTKTLESASDETIADRNIQNERGEGRVGEGLIMSSQLITSS